MRRKHTHKIDSRRLRQISFVLLFVIAANSAAVAQEKDAVDVVKVNTDLVVFDVQVIDKKTKTVVTNLTQAGFEIFDRGTKQIVTWSRQAAKWSMPTAAKWPANSPC